MEYDNKINDEGIRHEIVNWVKVAHDNSWDGVFWNGDESVVYFTRQEFYHKRRATMSSIPCGKRMYVQYLYIFVCIATYMCISM
jgi:hypothetical protein